ncbi:MAG: SDR family NAD(P)-dependent oxidoreductase [Flammeovirgaceae bacterium]
MRILDGKVAVVTGAASGIGRELAIQLAQKGAILVITDFNAAQLAETLKAVQAIQPSSQSYVFDVSDKRAFQQFAQEAITTFKHIDIVINNAGVALGKYTVEQVSYDDFEWIVGINLWGMIYGTKEFLTHLKSRPEAYIVNVSSLFGLIGVKYQAAYCTTKFAIRGFTESLRQELAHTNVRVLAVHPGGIKTNIARSARHHDPVSKTKMAKGFDAAAKTTADRAAQQIIKAMQQKQERLLIGKDAKFMEKIVRLFPKGYDWVVQKMAGK